MSDITLTITLDEEDARAYAARPAYGLYSPDISAVRKAIAAALPPESPKEGDVWSEGSRDWLIGPTWRNRTLVCAADNSHPVWSVPYDYIAKNWTKVR